MKKSLIAAAVAASVLAPVAAHAVNVSPIDAGEVLLYPYYNVNDGNVTWISLVNTTNYVKVYKVRFREGVESEDVFDFQLWLSPHDHFGMLLSQVGSSVRVTTADSSCTVPKLDNTANFITNRVSSAYTGDVLTRISEGHVEIIEMAMVYGALADAATHGPGGTPPPGCSTLIAQNGLGGVLGQPIVPNDYCEYVDIEGPLMSELCYPEGGTYGLAAVFNPTDGTYFTYGATALDGFADTPIFYPQRSAPLGDGLNHMSDEVTVMEHGVLMFDVPDISTPDGWERTTSYTINSYTYLYNDYVKVGSFVTTNDTTSPPEKKRDAVTASLMVASMANDFFTGDLYDTDWVFTFPGRYAYRLYPGAAETDYLFDPVGPFDPEGPVVGGVHRASGQGCERVDIFSSGEVGVFDREEDPLTGGSDVGFSPGVTPDPFALCYEVNVVAINDESTDGSSALSSRAIRQDASGWPTYGYAQLGFSTTGMTDDTGTVHGGLPFLGFAAVTDRQGEVDRGGAFAHKQSRGRGGDM